MNTWLNNWFPTFIAIYGWWARRLTASGRTLFVVLLATLPGVFTEQRFALQMFGGLASAFVAVGWIGHRYRPKLTVLLSMPESVQCGVSVTLRAHIRNDGPRACFSVVILPSPAAGQWQCQPCSPIPELLPGASLDVSVMVTPLRRGRWPLPPLQMTTIFPLGLMYRSQQVSSVQQVVVIPAFEAIQLAPAVNGGASTLPSVPETAAQQGDSREYYGSREYQSGMSVRRWDYGAWARLGKPFVREYERQTQANAAVVIDVSSSPSDQQQKLEAAVSVAASIIDALSCQGWQIHLFLAAGTKPWIQWEPSLQARGVLMERLADLQASDEPWERLLEEADQSGLPLWEMTIFMVVQQWDDQRDSWHSQWLSRCPDVRCFLAREIETETPSFVRRPPALQARLPLASDVLDSAGTQVPHVDIALVEIDE